MRRCVTGLILGMYMSWVVLPAARTQGVPADPVQQLNETLARVVISPDDAAWLNYRAVTLLKQVAALKTTDQMRQALMLDGWKDNDRLNPKLAVVDGAARAALAERFGKELEKAAKAADEPTRLAVVQLLGSLGNVRAVEPANPGGMGRSLTPLVVQLCGDKSPTVRAAAVKALAQMNPEPATAAGIFKALLEDKEVEVRRAAAGGLVTLVTVTHSLQKKGRAQNGTEIDRAEVIAAAKAVVNVAAPGAADAEVRRLCLKALKEAAVALSNMVPDPMEEFAPVRAGAPLLAAQIKELARAQEIIEEERKLFLPLIEALVRQSKTLKTALQDADEGVVKEAIGVIEELAAANQRLRARAASVPPLVAPDYFGDELRAAVPLLAKKLQHPSVDVKLAVLYALETLERDASPAAAATAAALDDANPFVRWGAARALGRMAGFKGPDVTVAVNALGKHLSDENTRVRSAAAIALARYGLAAKPALNDVTAAIKKGDPALRQQAMQVVVGIGADAKPAVLALTEALTAKEKAVRLAAARTLAELGPLAAEALPALERAMDDADDDVRLAAAAAVLAIKAPVK